jgi:quercetin 2,3-dioxygenase
MVTLRKSSDRGQFANHWLKSFHSFSFSSYYDPEHMDFSHLRVINEDWVQPHQGFGFHPHRDMEIVTFMLDGELQHKDSLGNVHTLKSGNAQLMRAGSGIVHSEMNMANVEAHLLQIWIKPRTTGLKPGWWEKEFTGQGNILIAQPIQIIAQEDITKLLDIETNGLEMAQNGYIMVIRENTQLDFSQFGQSHVYIHQIQGEVQVNDAQIQAGDAWMAENVAQPLQFSEQSGASLIFVFPTLKN